MMTHKLSRIAMAAIVAVASFVTARAQNDSQAKVEWTVATEMTTPTEGVLIFSAAVPEKVHFYSLDNPEVINSMTITYGDVEGVELGEPVASTLPVTYNEPLFDNIEVSAWFENVSLSVPFTIADPDEAYKLTATLRWQACDESMCYTPRKEKFTFYLGNAEKAAALESEDAAEKAVLAESGSDNPADYVPVVNATAEQIEWWQPVDMEKPGSDHTPWEILIIGFLGGLAALLTPCVWPLIPMTLSFFLKKKKNKKKLLNTDVLLYGLSIVVIFLVLGIAITLLFGAGKLNELSTSAIFNLIFFALLVVFAVSFFGAFDIKLPKRWSNAMDSKAESTTGVISIFFMAFTLVLVSFSCTGPIIGTLLVEAASQGDIAGPAFGMGGFALGLALPFTICAVFPGMLKEMPKSGGWLNTVKVVLGFIELILSLKFLSVADLAYGWHILDREVFVSLWIVMFLLLGFYLLGKIRFPHDAPSEHTGVGRFFLALLPLSFAVYLIPGLWGAPLKAISAFAPPLSTQDFNLYTHDITYTTFDDYDEGMQYAKEHNMPVLLDFSGYGCVNCREMEADVFDTDRVREYIADNYVVITLMVDDKAKLPMPVTIIDNGDEVEIETVGEKWGYLQSHKFGMMSQPYYVMVDNQGRPLNTMPYFYKKSVSQFVDWLSTGVDAYAKQKYLKH